MKTQREAFEEAVKHLPNLPSLPIKAYLGDICRHDGKLWIYHGQGVWTEYEQAMGLVFEVTSDPPTT